MVDAVYKPMMRTLREVESLVRDNAQDFIATVFEGAEHKPRHVQEFYIGKDKCLVLNGDMFGELHFYVDNDKVMAWVDGRITDALVAIHDEYLTKEPFVVLDMRLGFWTLAGHSDDRTLATVYTQDELTDAQRQRIKTERCAQLPATTRAFS
jgi:hypothetical protein